MFDRRAHMWNALGVLFAAALWACSDDDTSSTMEGTRDASTVGGDNRRRDSGPTATDAGVDSGPTATDAGVDSGLDASDTGADPLREPPPCSTAPLHLPDGSPPSGATRVPLEVLCDDACASARSADFAELTCYEVDADGGVDSLAGTFDASIHSGNGRFWTRSEGCGSVQYATVSPDWPRFYNFDADTGDLIGAIRVDDIAYGLEGWPCESFAWIAGEVRLDPCADETQSLCD